jgi:hypothetical protein
MQLTGWGCGGTRKINRLFGLPLSAADAQALGPKYLNDPLDYTNRKGLVYTSEQRNSSDKAGKHH